MPKYRKTATRSRAPHSHALSQAIGQALRTPRTRRQKSAAILLAALALAAPAVQAQSTEWADRPGFDWYNAGLWTQGVPTAGTDAYILTYRNESNPHIDGGNAFARDLFMGAGTGLFIENNASLTNRDSNIAGLVLMDEGSAWRSRHLAIGAPVTSLTSLGHVLMGGGTLDAETINLGKNVGERGSLTVVLADASVTANQITVGGAGGGELNVDRGAQVTADNVIVGEQQGSSGTVTVQEGGSLDIADRLTVGKSGAGTMFVRGQGSVSAVQIMIGQEAGSSGSVLVDGPLSRVRSTENEITVGQYGTGELIIQNGATVEGPSELRSTDLISVPGLRIGESDGSQGRVVVTGENSLLTMANDLYVGNHGQGRLEILDGGTVHNYQAFIGAYNEDANGGGEVLVQGEGSNWNIHYGLFVGNYHDGSLEIADGGVVTNDESAFIGHKVDTTGAVHVHGAGSTWNSMGAIGVGVSGLGTLQVTDGGTVNAVEGIGVGSPSSRGEASLEVAGADSRVDAGTALYVSGAEGARLWIHDGGTVEAGEAYIGQWYVQPDPDRFLDTRGEALIEGDGSRLSVAGWFSVGRNDGKVTVRDGGTLATGEAQIGTDYHATLGKPPGERAEVWVEGAGSIWEASGPLTVGVDGHGLLEVSQGGVVNSTRGVLGQNEQSIGTGGLARIYGSDSVWNLDNDLAIGWEGQGRVEISDGGAVEAASTEIGATEPAIGALLVDGANSHLRNAGSMAVGAQGRGSVEISNEGQVSSNNAVIGSAAGAHGEVTLQGAGSTWTTAGATQVGLSGTGVLSVLDGAELEAETLDIGIGEGSQGTVLFSGAGTQWNYSKDLSVGVQGHGVMRIENGAKVSTDEGWLGYDTGRGQVVVDGAGSEWESTELSVGLGGNSDGELTLSNNGRVAVSGPMLLAVRDGSTGILNIGAGGAAGVLETGAVGTGAGTGIVNFNHDEANLVFDPLLTGTLSVHQVGTGTTTLVSDNDYTGGTFIEDGVLQLGNGGETGSLVGDVQVDADATLVFNRSNAYQFEWDILGAGSVHQRGSGTTIFVTDQGYTGGTLIRDGVLQLGNGGSTGSLVGDVETEGDGTLAFNRNNAYDFLGSIGGTGNVHHVGTGATTFSGTSSYTGDTDVRSGTVLVEGTLGDTTTTVHAGATLGGTGRIAGDVIVNDGGTLSPGTSPGTLTVGSLYLSEGAFLDYELGQAGVIGSGINDLIEIDGDLTLDGTLDVTDAGGFGVGVYRLMNYGGALTNNVLDLGALPAGVDSNDLFVQTAIAGQVNLINTAGISVNFWDGAAGPTDDGVIQGGDGVWVSNDRSWTLPDGSLNGKWNEGFAVFGGASGTVTVMGEQRFTGMQFMTDGYRLEPGTDAALRASGTTNLRVDPGVTATIAAPIVGDATLVKVDEGTLVLEGEFGYTGGVTVNGGRLVGDTGNLLGDVLNRAELEFAQDEDDTYAGLISGSGQLIKSGDGSLTVTGANTYTGGTRVESGTLRIGDGGMRGSIVGDVRIDADGAFAFDRSDSFTFDGSFSGTGLFDKYGAGTLTLTGDSAAYVGHGTLRDGGLHMLGTIGGQFDVLAGTTLSGIGTLGSVDNAGTIAPGGSIGTLHMTGDFVHRDGATYNVDISPNGSSDLLDIAGTATIEGGEVYVTKAIGQYAGGSRYTIVEAEGGVTGTYDVLDQNLPFLDMFLSYDPNHVYLDILRNDTDFSILCPRGTFNQCQVAGALDRISKKDVVTPDLQHVLSEVTTLDADAALASFDRMSGEAHASLAGIMLEGHALFGQTVTRRLAERRESEGARELQGGAWVRTYGADADLGGDGNAYGADYRLHGLAVGFDAWGTEEWLIGASANLMRVDADFRPGDKAEADAKNVSIYTGYHGQRAYVDGVVSFAWWDSDVTRAVDVASIHRTAKSDYGSNRMAIHLEAGRTYELGSNQTLQPFATFQRDVFDVQAFREHGADDIDIVSHSQGGDRITTGLGLRWSGEFKSGEWTIAPTAQARWLHTTGDRTVQFELAYAGAPDVNYLVRGATFPKDRGLVGLGLSARKDNIDLFVDYDYQSGEAFKAHNLSAGLRYRW